jgi:hypothetical protein
MKKKGVTKKKRNRKREREKEAVQAPEACPDKVDVLGACYDLGLLTNKRPGWAFVENISGHKKPQDMSREIKETFLVFQKTGTGPSEQQLQAERLFLRVLEGLPQRTDTYPKAILYSGKLAQSWNKPLTVAKYLAEELRANPPYGAALLMKEVLWHWNVEGFVSKMLEALITYLKDQQTVFAKIDYQIADIVQRYPNYTISEITSTLVEENPKQYAKQKRKTLERRVQRLLENFPR